MKTADLIQALTKQAAPVRRPVAMWKTVILWLFGAAGMSVLYLVTMRGADSAVTPNDTAKVIEAFLLVAISSTAAVGALTGSIPGRKYSGFLVSSLAALLVWILFRSAGTIFTHSPMDLVSWPCMRDIVVPGLLATVVLVWVCRKAAPLNGGFVGLLAGAAGLGVSALLMQFFCHATDSSHLLLWHAVPVIVFSAITGLAGRRFLAV